MKGYKVIAALPSAFCPLLARDGGTEGGVRGLASSRAEGYSGGGGGG